MQQDIQGLESRANQDIRHPDNQIRIRVSPYSEQDGRGELYYVHGVAFRRDRHRSDDPSMVYTSWASLRRAVMRHHGKYAGRQ